MSGKVISKRSCCRSTAEACTCKEWMKKGLKDSVIKKQTRVDDSEEALTKSPTRENVQDFPGSTVDKNPPANAGDTDVIPGPGRFHMPWSN